MESKTLKLGIVGHGFVGKAVDYGFTQNLQKYIVDPVSSRLTLSDILSEKASVAFIAVPTPPKKTGEVDDSILFEIVRWFAAHKADLLLIVKSTAPPTTFTALKEIYPRLIYNPEFLTELNSKEDFIHPPMHIFGGSKEDVDFAEEIYTKHSICAPCPVYKTDIRTASLVKYTINTFLASKVVFFNQLKDIYEETLGDENGDVSSWEEFIEIVSSDTRIGSSHMKVPGHDGLFGFGGSCFPKDTKAFAYYAKSINADFQLLEKAIEINKRCRFKEDEKTSSFSRD